MAFKPVARLTRPRESAPEPEPIVEDPPAEVFEATRREEGYDAPRERKANAARLLPQATDAEAGLIGCIFIASRSVLKACRLFGVMEEWFFVPAHKLIYRACVELDSTKGIGDLEIDATGKPSSAGDFIIVTTYLRDRGILEECGGRAYITELFASEKNPSAHLWGEYANILKEKHTLRVAITGHLAGIEQAYEGQFDVPAVVKHAQQLALKISEAYKPRDRHKTNAAVVAEILNDFSARDREKMFGKRITIAGLEREIKGVMPTDLIIVAAGTSSGKSALALQLSTGHVQAHGERVLYFTFEMSRRQVLTRAMQLFSKVNLAEQFDVQAGLDMDGTAAQKEAAIAEAAQLASTHLFDIIDNKVEFGNIVDIEAECRRQHAQDPIGMVVLDYDELIQGRRSRGDSKENELSSIAAGMKGIAVELKCVAVLLSQVTEGDKEVTTRGSRGKLNAANVALFIEHVDDYRKWIHVWKNRDGKRGPKIPYGFDGGTGEFYLSTEEELESGVVPTGGKKAPQRGHRK